MKRAFLFPGQGAQSIGMGKDIYEKYEEARKVFDEASNISEIDVKKLCFEGPEDELNKTENTQLAIMVTSLAILEVLKSKNIDAKITCGLSLGEYTALVYAGIISFKDGYINFIEFKNADMKNEKRGLRLKVAEGLHYIEKVLLGAKFLSAYGIPTRFILVYCKSTVLYLSLKTLSTNAVNLPLYGYFFPICQR